MDATTAPVPRETEPVVRNARAEASDRLGPGRSAAVLEPSPPAVGAAPWFADHPPTTPPEAGDVLVSPLGIGADSWAAAVAADPTLAEFATARWLASFRPLPQPPPSLAETRRSLVQLAFHVISPARHAATGKIGLRWVLGGFGTPFFGDDTQIRVEGTRIVVQQGSTIRHEPITTLRAAGELVGVTPGPAPDIDFHDPPAMVDLDEPLTVDADAVAFLDAWFGFATAVLERLLLDAGDPDDSRVQLWPEHFDPAIELGDDDAGTRASFGASPGDESISQPYLYVGPWTPQTGEPWTAPFGGAAMTLEELRHHSGQVGRALAFYDRCRRALG